MALGSVLVPALFPGVFAQVASVSNPNALAPLALRRWCGSLTLASPETAPSFFAYQNWAAALGALFLLVLVVQGPARALRQLAGLPGHVRLVAAATARLRGSGRLLVLLIGTTVLSWTAGEAVTFGQVQNNEAREARAKEDLQQLTRSRGLQALAVEQGGFAALTPLRDVAGLGGNLPLLALATLLLFRAAADLIGGDFQDPLRPRPPAHSGWANVAWVCGALLLVYRLVAVGMGSAELPLGGCLMVEAAVVPAFLLVCDAVLLAWVLAELRDSGLRATPADPLRTRAAAELVPGAMLGCLVALPARYAATALLLASSYFPSTLYATAVGSWSRWLLGRGLADLEAGGLVALGLVGAVAWTRGSMGEAVRGYFRLLAEEGARVVVVLALAGLAAGLAAAACYAAVLALPTTFWLLPAADAYAHFATTAVGLWALAALVELAEGTLPAAVEVSGGAGPG